jgi:hypothetical protein
MQCAPHGGSFHNRAADAKLKKKLIICRGLKWTPEIGPKVKV